MEEDFLEVLGEMEGEEEENEEEEFYREEEFGESKEWAHLDLRESFSAELEESAHYPAKEPEVTYLPPLEAIAALKASHMTSVPERIRRNKINELIDDLKDSLPHASKTAQTSMSRNLIIDNLTIDHLKMLKTAFQRASFVEDDIVVREAFSKSDLKDLVERTCHVTLSDEKWDMIFIEMDVNNNGSATYREFISYLLLEFRIKKNVDEDIALWMLEDPIQDLPTFIKSHHQHGVTNITFFPLVKRFSSDSVRKSSFANGKYFTVSEQGTVNMWSLNMELENTQECPSPVLHFAKTCVITIAALADINLIALSSTERDLRFYDTTGRHYQLKTRIIRLPFPATALCYHFYEDINFDSIFVFGDSEGSVCILQFSSKQGSPLKKFERSPKYDYQCITYESLVKDAHVPQGLKMDVFKNLHSAVWVTKIVYSDTIWPGKKSIVSCANCLNFSLVFIDLAEMSIVKKFKIVKGVNTFCLISGLEQVVTGGFDTIIRLWDIKTSKKALSSLSGHYAPIDAIYEQHKGARLFTISRDRIIKVWDMKEMVCIQTCTNKLQELGEAPLVCYYNPYYRKCILAAKNIAHFKLGSEVNRFFSDGYTHVGGVTKALYNPLFKVMVTVGMDSNIMTWDLWRGKLVFVVRKAHKKRIFGEDKPMGITSAIFSPSKVYLLTGALDGSIKMWNFTIGTCIRTMHIKEDCVVTGLIWVPGRILACGWSTNISEWEDKVEPGDCKDWAAVHTKDVLCMSQCGPKAIVTAAYNGELVFYNLQNGHYYNRYFVGKPKLPITMGFAAAFRKDTDDFEKRGKLENAEGSFSLLTMSEDSSSAGSYGKPPGVRKDRIVLKQSSFEADSSTKKEKPPFVKSEDHPCECEPPCQCQAQVFKGFAGPDKMEVHSLLFLETRPEHPDVGSLFVSLQTGSVQFWSHHPKGGIVDTFYAVHIIGDHVTTMSSTVEDDFLFTGTRFGYVKIWHIVNFCILPQMTVQRAIPALRLQFPFLMKDVIPGRAKRAVRGQLEPFLCSSCRNHVDRIMNIEILDSQKIYITCGIDRSVRFWTYGGVYIGTLGGINPWIQLDENEITEVPNYRIPADLTRVVSSTSFKVLTARTTVKSPYPHVKQPEPTEEEEKVDSVDLDQKCIELDQMFRGICNFPEENRDYRMKLTDVSDTEVIQKNMKEPVLRVLNMLKTVGQYDMNPPRVERTAKYIKQLLDDPELKSAKGRPTPGGQPTRTRPKERWVDRLPSFQKFWRTSPADEDQMTVVSVVSQKSDASWTSVSTSTSKWRQGLSPEAKTLEFLLKDYEESAKGWYRQQYS